ncbi:MAG: glycosyl hydrolase family 28-related protein, partial [Saprospiraceae bacterium]
MNKILLVFILFGPGLAKAQNIPPHRTSNWSNAGCIDTFSFIRTSLFLEDFFDVNDPLSFQDSAFEHAINFIGNQPVRLIIPEGTFYFKNSIQLKSNVHIQGSGADKTILKFKPSNSPHAIIAHGKSTDSTYQIMQDLNKGSSSLMLENTDGLKEGDWLKLSFNDDEFITSSWALNSVGQFFQISSISGNSINLSETIRLNIPLTKRPVVELIRPLRNIYISDLKIEQENKNQNNGANIFFNLFVNSKIKSIHSKYSNFSHITLNSSSRISISCSFFELAHEYGGGGKGYGIALQSTSDDNLIENNIFDHLRHSILLQSGANGNVIAYNYSENPYWTEPFFPEDAAGDLVLHGNFPYLNLFEGNICQNIVIDNSHGINGPFNTFFRNRALRYGLFMNDSPASDQQNFIGNVISEEE